MINIGKKIKASVFALGFLFSGYCSAGNGWTGYGTFTNLTCMSENDALVGRCILSGFTGTATEPTISFCGKPWGTLYMPGEAAQNSKQVFATVLMAYSAGKQVRLYSNGCFEGYPLVGGVEVKN
jgi:hypothetical protein